MNTYEHVKILKKIFDNIGISGDRINQYFCSAAEVEHFIQSVEDIVAKVEALPPLPKRKSNPKLNDPFK